jgi:putative transposase
VVDHLQSTFGLSIRRSCQLSDLPRSTYNYTPKPKDDERIIDEINIVLSKYNKYGCGMIHLKLRQRGNIINHKRTERIYRELGLQLHRRKRRKKITSVERSPVELPNNPGELWAMDFVSDSIANSRKLKILTVIDPVTNKSPLIHPDTSIPGYKVTQFLERTAERVGYPKYIQCDNGPEFRSIDLDQWCYKNNIKILFSRPGKPMDNCHIESFNGTFRYECLNSHYFSSLKEAKRIIEEWRIDYNDERPQKRLKGLTPSQYEIRINRLETNLATGPN